MTREDFVKVKLNADGERLARGGPRPRDYDGPAAPPCVRLSGGAGRGEGGYEFSFSPGEVQEVTRAEWNAVLEPSGLFELAPQPAASQKIARRTSGGPAEAV